MSLSKRKSRDSASDHIPYVLPVEGGFFGREYPYIDIPGYGAGEVVTFIGSPDTDFSKEPVIRDATLDDFQHDCPECRRSRKQILSGKTVRIADYTLNN